MITKLKTIGLDAQLAEARKKLLELSRLHDEASGGVRDLQGALIKAEAAAQREREDALMDNRQPSAKTLAAPDPIRAALETEQVRLDTAAGAVRRQGEAIEAIKSEMDGQQRSRVLEAIQAPAQRARTLIDELAGIAAQITREAVMGGNISLVGTDVFPMTGTESQTDTDLRTAILLQAKQLADYQSMFSGRKAA